MSDPEWLEVGHPEPPEGPRRQRIATVVVGTVLVAVMGALFVGRANDSLALKEPGSDSTSLKPGPSGSGTSSPLASERPHRSERGPCMSTVLVVPCWPTLETPRCLRCVTTR